MRALNLALAGGLALCVSPTSASIPIPTRITCPDGRAVETYEYAAYSTWGRRPDGKPYGSAGFPLPLVECADGLVMYKNEFTSEEVERLRPLVASAAYAALRAAGDTSYYRAYWLMRQMDAPPREQLIMLVQALWQTDGAAELRQRYLQELVARAADAGGAADVVGLALRSWVANALRELGRFDEAAAMLRTTSFGGIERGENRREAREWRRYYRRLARVIARRDQSIEPRDMIPRMEARHRRSGASPDD